MIQNLLDVSAIQDFSGEVFETLAAGRSFELKRIVSSGQCTPPGQLYDQQTDEWVLLLSGNAQIEFPDSGDLVDLAPGDYLLIPARRKHRVVRTDSEQKTVWLALYFTDR